MNNYEINDSIFEEENDEDELDLVKLVSTNANDLNQYLIFKGSNDEWYAMNVSKIEEIMVYDETIDIVHNNDKDDIIYGTADIRNTMTTLIYFDDWYGNPHLSDSDYELIVLANYGGHKLGIIVKEVAHIITIESQKMSDNSQNNAKSTFVAKISIASEDHMCTIYDGDKMLLDIFDNIQEQSEQFLHAQSNELLHNKTVYFADDSKFVRSLVEQLFSKLDIEYKIFSDGSLLIDYIEKHPQTKVDLFITDLEMPTMGGREVISNIRQNSFYDPISILVHTNMSNTVMETELIHIGANAVIGKVNLVELSQAMIREIQK
jgi:two-component system, chemotaxis family, chemotaxis protein CheV